MLNQINVFVDGKYLKTVNEVNGFYKAKEAKAHFEKLYPNNTVTAERVK